jgi:outer membrane protein
MGMELIPVFYGIVLVAEFGGKHSWRNEMKNFFVMLLAVFCSGIILTASAAAAGSGVKIATMDLKKVLEVSAVGRDVQASVKKKYDEYQGKLSQKEEELVALQGEIEKKRTVWSEDVLSQKERELKRGIQDLQTDTKYADNDMQDYQKKQVGPILQELETIIDAYGKSHGISLIFDTSRGVLYQDEALDISVEIAAELDKKHAQPAK